MSKQDLIVIQDLKKYFDIGKKKLHAVDGISFNLKRGETLGLVGESGCGKSTVGRTIAGLLKADGGSMIFDGEDLIAQKSNYSPKLRQSIQMVFQDPYSSLDPRVSIGNAIAEPLVVNKIYKSKKELNQRIGELMSIVGIDEKLMNSYPHELDGGLRQRVGIARSLAINPDFIILDEPVSALDVCIQAQVLNLLKDLQRDYDLTYLFISHDLSVVKFISDRIAVMYLGQIVELSDHHEIFKLPYHPYTMALLSAIPSHKKRKSKDRIILKGDVPSPVEPPEGCRFAGRCIYAKDRCRQETPELREVEANRFAACHYVFEIQEENKRRRVQ